MTDKPRREDEDDVHESEDEEELSGSTRAAIFIAVLVVLGMGVIFIDRILRWILGR